MALNLASLSESEERNTTADPRDETRCVGKVDEPRKDSRAGIGAVKVCETAEERGRDDSHVWNTLLGALLEDGWGVAGNGKRVEGSGGHVEEGVAGRPSGGDDNGVDDAAEATGNTSAKGSNHECGGSSTDTAVGEALIVGWANDADSENAAHIEEDETVHVSLSGLGEIATRVLHLTTSNDEEFGREGEREGRRDNGADEGDKGTNLASQDPGVVRSWIFPVVETQNAVLVGTATPEEDEGHNKKTNLGQVSFKLTGIWV